MLPNLNVVICGIIVSLVLLAATGASVITPQTHTRIGEIPGISRPMVQRVIADADGAARFHIQTLARRSEELDRLTEIVGPELHGAPAPDGALPRFALAEAPLADEPTAPVEPAPPAFQPPPTARLTTDTDLVIAAAGADPAPAAPPPAADATTAPDAPASIDSSEIAPATAAAAVASPPPSELELPPAGSAGPDLETASDAPAPLRPSLASASAPDELKPTAALAVDPAGEVHHAASVSRPHIRRFRPRSAVRVASHRFRRLHRYASFQTAFTGYSDIGWYGTYDPYRPSRASNYRFR